MYHTLFIHLSVDRHLVCFHVLVIVNSAAMNTGVPAFFSIKYFSGICPVVGLMGHLVVFIPSFLRNLHTVVHSDCINLHSYQLWKKVPFYLHSFQHFFLCIDFFDNCQSDRCVVIPQCSFDLHFSNNEQCWAFFHVFVDHLYIFFGEISVLVFSPFFNWAIRFSDVELYVLLIYFGD